MTNAHDAWASIDASIRARAATNGRRARECDAASRSGFQSPRRRARRARAMGAYARERARGTTMTGAPKLEFVREMFDRVAETYDVVNGWLAFGFVDAWRARSRGISSGAERAP